MENTSNLKLPLLIPNQSGKEIIHNEALIVIDNLINNGVIDKDLITPPTEPNQNDLYIVGLAAINDWAERDNQLTYYDNGWRFYTPRKGTKYWVNDEACLYIFNGTSWSKFIGGGGSSSGNTGNTGVSSLSELNDVSLISLSKDDLFKFNGASFVNSKKINNLTEVGINCDADLDNKLSVKSDFVLFDNNGHNSKIKANKLLNIDTASHLFQTNYSGRAEFGLIGDDNFTLKVSTDGNNWNNAFVVDKTTGNIDFKGKITKNGSEIGGFTGGGSENTNVWISEQYSIIINTPTIAIHNLNLENPLMARGDMILQCIANDAEYVTGDFAINCGGNTYAYSTNNALPFVVALTSNHIQVNSPNDCIYAANKNHGNRTVLDTNKWKYIFRIFY